MREVIKTDMCLLLFPKICLNKLSVKVKNYFVEESCFFDDILKLIWKHKKKNTTMTKTFLSRTLNKTDILPAKILHPVNQSALKCTFSGPQN